MPTQTPMDAAKKVVVTAYEELPRRRPGGYVATSSTAARAKTRAPSTPTHAAVGGGYNRRAMLLAYAQHLRRRGGGQRSPSGPPVLGWGEWKQADPGAGNDDHKVAEGRRSWCSRFRSWLRLWIRTFFRRVRTISENASCKKGD